MNTIIDLGGLVKLTTPNLTASKKIIITGKLCNTFIMGKVAVCRFGQIIILDIQYNNVLAVSEKLLCNVLSSIFILVEDDYFGRSFELRLSNIYYDDNVAQCLIFY